jgi:hypothetical protein
MFVHSLRRLVLTVCQVAQMLYLKSEIKRERLWLPIRKEGEEFELPDKGDQ